MKTQDTKKRFYPRITRIRIEHAALLSEPSWTTSARAKRARRRAAETELVSESVASLAAGRFGAGAGRLNPLIRVIL
jgi:hypothetical protein